MRQERGILRVVSGFSGSGKGTVMKRLLEKYPENYALSISATTRNPRPGEVSGRNTPIFWNKNGKPILPISRPKMI